MNFDKLIDYFGADRKEFYFQFNSHPDYPSALAFSDTLNFLGIKNDAYELEKEYWHELPEEYMGIVHGKFSLLKKEGNQFKIYSDTVTTLSEKEVLGNSQDFVMLFEKHEIVRETSPFNYKTLIYFVFGLIVLYSLINLQWFETAFNILSLAGVFISMEIFNQKFGHESKAMSNICGGADSEDTKEGCFRIIAADKTSILGLKIADFSLIYFVSIALLGLLLPQSSIFLRFFSFASIAVIGYSLYVQVVVEKTFCRICLLIIAILTFQLLINLFLMDSAFTIQGIFAGISIFTVVFAVVHYIGNLMKEHQSVSDSNARNLKFKRNYTLFKRELFENGKIIFDNPAGPFFIGNPDAPLHITLISNPYCGFCKEGHEILEKLLLKYPDSISSQIRFNYSSAKSTEELTNLMTCFKNIYDHQGSKKFLGAVHEWYENRNLENVMKLFPNENLPANLDELQKNTEENLSFGLNFTPLFLLNGRQFPEMYSREDIFFFIDELIEDEEIIQ